MITYILYNGVDEKEIQNSSIVLLDNEYPIFDCYAKDTNDQFTYLLITTHYLIYIVDVTTYKADIECISFNMEIEDIISIRKNRKDYIEYVKYELESTIGNIPIWVECGICENILVGIFKQINFLKTKYGITNN